MIFVLRIGAAMAAFGLFAARAEPAAAQGFFQSLFGSYSNPAPVRRMPSQSPYDRGHYSPYWDGTYGYAHPPRPQESRLRAVCVRTCDGFYWPMTSRAKRSQLYGLSKTCSASCNGGARLFYTPTGSTDTAGMIDMEGRPYAMLETAFVYRKKYIRGCQCKPVPWSYAERRRHQSYAQVTIKKEIQSERSQTEISDGTRTVIESLDDDGDLVHANEWESGPRLATAADHPVSAASALPPATGQSGQKRRSTSLDKTSRPHRKARVTRARKAKPAWGLFGAGGQAKYVWPGDRRR